MGSLLDDLSNPDSDFYKVPVSERMGVVRALQQSDPEWMSQSTEWKADILKHAGVDTKVMETAAKRKADLQAQAAQPQQADPGYLERTARIAGEGAKQFNENLFSLDPRKNLAAVSGVGKTLFSPLTASFEEPLRQVAQGPLKMSGEPVEEFARGGADLLSGVAQTIGGAAYGAAKEPLPVKGVPEPPSAAGGADKDLIRLKSEEPAVMDTETGPVEKNPPPDEVAQRQHIEYLRAQGVDPRDPAQVAAFEAKRGGIPTPAIKPTSEPIISSETNPDGSQTINTPADTKPYEIKHEIDQHLVPDATGAPQGAEDNTHLLDGVPKTPDFTKAKIRSAVMTDEGKVVTGSDHGDALNRAEDMGLTVSKENLGKSAGWAVGSNKYFVFDSEFGDLEPNEENIRQFAAGKFGPKSSPQDSVPAASDNIPQGELPDWYKATADRAAARQEPPAGVVAKPGMTAGRNDIPSTAEPVIGPKETAAQGIDENPETTYKDRWQQKQEQPLPDTPKPSTPQEAAQRTGLMALANKIFSPVVRGYQAAASSLSAGHIVVSNQVRLMSYAIKRAVTGSGEGLDLFSRMYTSAGREATADAMSKLLAAHPEEIEKYLQGGMFAQGENKFADTVGKLNFMAHRIAKPATLVARLKGTMLRQGLDFDSAMSDPAKLIPEANFKDALAFGNKYAMTFSPSSYSKGLEGALGSAMQAANKFPLLSRTVSLFPRYVANSIIAMTEDNPLLLGKLFTKEHVAATLGTANDTVGMARASGALGASIIYAGYKMRENHPGVGTVNLFGTDVDMTHQIPGIGQLAEGGAFLYDMTHPVPGREAQQREQALANLGKSVFGMPGLAVTIFANLARGYGAEQTAANTLGTATRPLKGALDLIGMIDGESNKKRDTSGSILAPAQANIPVLANQLPEQRSPERPGPLHNTAGYLIGVRNQEPNTPVQDELRRLDIRVPWNPIKPAEGVSQEQTSSENLKYRTGMGPMVDQRVKDAMANPQYQAMNDAQKRAFLEKLLAPAKKVEKIQSGASIEELKSPAKRAEGQAVK